MEEATNNNCRPTKTVSCGRKEIGGGRRAEREMTMQKQKKVLIAEENGEFLKSLLASLREAGFECVTVPKNGDSVLSAVEKFHPDIVVMEAFMARLDALGVMKQLSAGENRRPGCMVVLSNTDSSAFEQQILSALPVRPDLLRKDQRSVGIIRDSRRQRSVRA